MWLHIEGYERRERRKWERTRVQCFYTARFGNSTDRFPSTLESFMPFEWDKAVKKVNLHAANKELRERKLKELAARADQLNKKDA